MARSVVPSVTSCFHCSSLTVLRQKPGAGWCAFRVWQTLASFQTHSSGICTYSVLMKEQQSCPPNTQNALKLSLTSFPQCIRWASGSKYSASSRSAVPSHRISSAELGVWSAVEWLKAETVWSPSCYLMLFFLSLAISTVTELFYRRCCYAELFYSCTGSKSHKGSPVRRSATCSFDSALVDVNSSDCGH